MYILYEILFLQALSTYISRLGWFVEFKTDLQGSIMGLQRVQIVIGGKVVHLLTHKHVLYCF